MTRSLAIAILIGILLLLAIVVILGRDKGLPGDAQQRLEAFLDAHVPGNRPEYQVGKAEHPALFRAAMGAAVYGESAYYQTLDNDGAEQPATLSSVNSDQNSSLRPVPYPPKEMWCIWLMDGENQPDLFVLLALHQDLYNADWLVHRLPASEDVSAVTYSLGCNSFD